MARCSIVFMSIVGALVALPQVAAADENTPCPASRPTPVIALVDQGAGSALYATQELGLKVTQPGEEFATARSVSAPGARVDQEGARGDVAALLWADRPGPLAVTVRVADRIGREDCTHTVSRTFTIAPATVTKPGKLKRPFLVDRRRKLWYRRVAYSFSVAPSGVAADRSPLTVVARTVRRARYPSPRTKAVTKVFGLRDFDQAARTFTRGCNRLICPPRARNGSAKAVEVNADERSGGVKIEAVIPTAYPSKSGRRLIPTPWGVDIQVLQSGRRVARMRAAGRCTDGGQAARCTFKRVSTKP